MENAMGWSTHHPVGLIYCAPQHCYRGYTLVAQARGGHYANLIDMEGHICHRWHSPEGIGYAYLLPDGHLLLRTHPPKEAGGAEAMGGSSGAILELDWESNVVWAYRNPMLHHDFERLPNGNTLVLLWGRIPAELTSYVRGGFTADDDPEQMFGDLVQEISLDGSVVYQWLSWEHLSVEEDVICPLEGRREWTHGNSLKVTTSGDLLVSYRQTSMVGIVDRASGHFRWKWGPGEVSHQHHPTYLDNGRVLLFDNGAHRRGVCYSRVIEVDPQTNRIVWEYRGEPQISFFSYNISSAERLPNGNTLICEGAPGRIFEVTTNKEIVWEYINPLFLRNRIGRSDTFEHDNAVFRAHRYGPDHPALQGKDLDPARYANLNRLYGVNRQLV
jgi:hypothetical protein